MNAMTHGIFARIPILPGEDKEFFKAIAGNIFNTYKPEDAMEVILVERITAAPFNQYLVGFANPFYPQNYPQKNLSFSCL